MGNEKFPTFVSHNKKTVMEKINELLEQRMEYVKDLENAQSDWFKEMLQDMIYNVDLQIKIISSDELTDD